jgi:hypothetical protein
LQLLLNAGTKWIDPSVTPAIPHGNPDFGLKTLLLLLERFILIELRVYSEVLGNWPAGKSMK